MKNQTLIDSSTLTSIADSYRAISNSTDLILMSDLPEKLKSLSGSNDLTNFEIDDSEWTRPGDMPNIESFDISSTDNIIIATYDNRNRDAVFSFWNYFGKDFNYEIGYMEEDSFIVLRSGTESSQAEDQTTSSYRQLSGTLEDYDHDYIVIKASPSAKPSNFGLYKYGSYSARDQKVVELIYKGSNLSSSPVFSSYPVSTYYTRHVKILDTPNITSVGGAFANCTKLKTVEFINSDLSNVTSIASTFRNCIELNKLVGFFENSFDKVTTQFSAWFMNCMGFTSIDMSKISFAGLTSTGNLLFNNMFPRLKYLKCGFKLPTVRTFSSYGFASLKALETLDLTECDFSKVTVFDNAFANMPNIKSIKLGNSLDTAKITSATSAFANCYKLSDLDLASDFKSLTKMSSMFSNCWSLQSIELNNLGEVTTASSAFDGCYALENIKLSGLSSKCTSKLSVKNCYNLQKVDLSDCDLSSYTMKDTFDSSGDGIYLQRASYVVIHIPLLDLSYSVNFTKESLIQMLTNFSLAPESGYTLKLNMTAFALLADADIKAAADKNWKIVNKIVK